MARHNLMHRLTRPFYGLADRAFIGFERANVHQNRWLREIPSLKGRVGGTHTVTEWAYTIGLMQAVAYQVADPKGDLDVLDVGCGSGRLSLAVAPLLGPGGRYVGIDVNERDLNFARHHYSDSRLSFVHLPHKNRSYAPDQAADFPTYPFPDKSFDLITALSVWTHLNEEDSLFYAKEISRVLRPGGKAIITFFYLDDDYEIFKKNVPERSAFSLRPPKNYIFTRDIDGSKDWLQPDWTPTPESVVGVSKEGMDRFQKHSGLKLKQVYRGNWKETVGLFFQDVLVFSKA